MTRCRSLEQGHVEGFGCPNFWEPGTTRWTRSRSRTPGRIWGILGEARRHRNSFADPHMKSRSEGEQRLRVRRWQRHIEQDRQMYTLPRRHIGDPLE